MARRTLGAREKVVAIYPLLVELYGEPRWQRHLPPVDQLVATILSQQTSSANQRRAFAALRERFPTWDEVVAAPVEEVKDAIYPAGLSSQKGPRIQQALRVILHERGAFELDFLEELSVDEAKAWLQQLKGVGPKTAAIVMLFTFNRPAFPVDTHIHRIARRVGLVPPRTSAAKTPERLQEIVDFERYYPFHIMLIRHGREICVARDPRCHICPLQAYCDYYQGFAS
jgi:endonuclease III